MNLFLVGREPDRRSVIESTFADEYPDVRLWHFRCIVDAGGALLRCRPSAIPDAVVFTDPVDGWQRTRLWECVTARRELMAVPVFTCGACEDDERCSNLRTMSVVSWRACPDMVGHQGAIDYARNIMDTLGSELSELVRKYDCRHLKFEKRA